MKQLLAILLVTVGVGVGAASLYFASLSGVMNKMGLVGGDFQQSVDQNDLARRLREQSLDQDCSMILALQLVPRYLLSHGQERVTLARDLASARIVCGVRQVQGRNIERGVYTIIKGLYYLKSHYIELRVLVQDDLDQCRLLEERQFESWVEGYLSATGGRAHDVVFEVYKQVEEARSRVEELCMD